MKPKRAIKVSVSINERDLAVFKQRAKRLYGGNVSAVIAEIAQSVREQEAREKLVAWLEEEHGPATKTELDAVSREWSGTRKPKKARRKVAA